MSKLSIYETKWTDLVFENRNKEYGAYQLRQESSKNSITALFTSLLIIAALGSGSMLISKFRTPIIVEPTIISCPITPIKLHPKFSKTRRAKSNSSSTTKCSTCNSGNAISKSCCCYIRNKQQRKLHLILLIHLL
jgi:hypothetical protein